LVRKDEKGRDKEKVKEIPKKKREMRIAPKTIVRLANKDLDGDKSTDLALTAVKGISNRMAKIFALQFEKEANISFNKKIVELNEDQKKILEEIILKPEEHGIPNWCLNKRNEYSSGKDSHLTMAELDFDARNVFKRLGEIKSYRGLRHVWKLPVRGQRTKSTHRGKGGSVSVTKKDNKKGGR